MYSGQNRRDVRFVYSANEHFGLRSRIAWLNLTLRFTDAIRRTLKTRVDVYRTGKPHCFACAWLPLLGSLKHRRLFFGGTQQGERDDRRMSVFNFRRLPPPPDFRRGRRATIERAGTPINRARRENGKINKRIRNCPRQQPPASVLFVFVSLLHSPCGWFPYESHVGLR